MFSWMKSSPFPDPQLGDLVRSRGYWRGTITLGDRTSPLAVNGNRGGPDSRALQVAHGLSSEFSDWKHTVETALFGHYAPYAEALTAGVAPLTREQLPEIEIPSQVWPHVTLAFVSVLPLDGELTVELGYNTAWDEEHTLGARFQSGQFIELCGNVVPS